MITEIKNIKLKDFDQLTDEEAYQYGLLFPMLASSKRLGTRHAKDLWEMEFAEVENLKKWIQDPAKQLEAVALVFDCPIKLMPDYRILQYFPALEHVKSELLRIVHLERQNLACEPDPKYMAAGGKELQRFGVLNTLKLLGMQHGKAPTEVEQWTYGLVHWLSWMNKIDREIEKEMHKK